MSSGLSCLRVVLLVCIALGLPACGLNEAQLLATATQIARNIYATLTASVPTPTLTPRPTATPAFDAFVNMDGVKVYSGPGQTYPIVGELGLQEGLTIAGRNCNCAWLKITAPSEGWVNTKLGKVALNLPCKTYPHAYYRPENGANTFEKRESYGLGRLEVDNGLSKDAHVILAHPKSQLPVCSMYIHSQGQATLVGIPNSEYEVFFSTGTDWDAVDYRFTSNAVYQKFNNTIVYETKNQKYTIWTITLHPVEGGTEGTESVPPDEFPAISE